ncbi:MAG: hypothetical protein ACKO24_14300 [Leptolyngbyaceae cyanobacterium]
MILTQLQEFRQAIYHCLGKARDAVFELMDAVLVSPSIPSFVSLSQSPVFRRKWSSVYAALQDSRPSRHKLMKLLTQQIPSEEQPLLVGDSSVWMRPDAAILPVRLQPPLSPH